MPNEVSSKVIKDIANTFEVMVEKKLDNFYTRQKLENKENFEEYLSSKEHEDRVKKWTGHTIEEYNEKFFKDTLEVDREDYKHAIRWMMRFWRRCNSFWSYVYSKALPATVWTVATTLMLGGIIYFIIGVR